MADYYTYERAQYGASYRVTHAVQRLILLNTLVFAGQLLLDVPIGYGISGLHGAPPGGILARWLAFQPSALLHGGLWKPFTYLFLHAGLMHLFLNMLWLFFFGPDVERALGTRQFYRFYLVCGAVGVLATFVPAVVFNSVASVTGASGAIMGVMVAFAVLNPEREFFLFPLPVPINARALVIIVIVFNVLTAFQPGSTTSIATHFGGMIVGFVYMKLIPVMLEWRREAVRHKQARKQDGVGDAVDNIFKFEDRKHREKR